LGPSACSFVDGIRTRNWSNTRLYCEQLERRALPIESRDILPPPARAGEIAAFGLRMTVGWGFEEFTRVTGFDLRRGWADAMAQLVERGWGERDDAGFRLTPYGLRFADAAAQMFLLPESEPV
jgi:oxygen-independent coproporphyrinogen-3 oxidase